MTESTTLQPVRDCSNCGARNGGTSKWRAIFEHSRVWCGKCGSKLPHKGKHRDPLVVQDKRGKFASA